MEQLTDDELLRLAAKSCGLSIVYSDNLGGFSIGIPYTGSDERWNPLDDDRDALRLAVALRLTISWDRFNDDDYVNITPPHTHQGYDFIVDQDPNAAMRRAIVRTAAEIGKS